MWERKPNEYIFIIRYHSQDIFKPKAKRYLFTLIVSEATSEWTIFPTSATITNSDEMEWLTPYIQLSQP